MTREGPFKAKGPGQRPLLPGFMGDADGKVVSDTLLPVSLIFPRRERISSQHAMTEKNSRNNLASVYSAFNPVPEERRKELGKPDSPGLSVCLSLSRPSQQKGVLSFHPRSPH